MSAVIRGFHAGAVTCSVSPEVERLLGACDALLALLNSGLANGQRETVEAAIVDLNKMVERDKEKSIAWERDIERRDQWLAHSNQLEKASKKRKQKLHQLEAEYAEAVAIADERERERKESEAKFAEMNRGHQQALIAKARSEAAYSQAVSDIERVRREKGDVEEKLVEAECCKAEAIEAHLRVEAALKESLSYRVELERRQEAAYKARWQAEERQKDLEVALRAAEKLRNQFSEAGKQFANPNRNEAFRIAEATWRRFPFVTTSQMAERLHTHFAGKPHQPKFETIRTLWLKGRRPAVPRKYKNAVWELVIED
ncbi:hypothetical protein KUW04_16435 [Halomonas denitrificans]|nr:hypothetical protein [Halomonas denitrificans]